MKITLRWLLLFPLLSLGAIGVFCGPVDAQQSERKDSDFIARDFKFQSGETLPELRIHYVTFGTLKRDAAGHATNAVLILHGTMSSSATMISNFAGELFGAGQALDAAKYFVIIPDSIGHGPSSKPSDGLRTKFPHYGYNDMVEAQHRLVAEGLGIDHLRLVLGTSMGGMHTWLWSEKYPDMMDGVMPITSQPAQISGHNFLWRHILTEAIRNDPDWKGGAYEKQPSNWLSIVPLFRMMISSRARLNEAAATTAKSIDLYSRIVDDGRKVYDANNFLYALESSSDYDPEPGLGKIKARLLALNFADDLINAAEFGLVEQAVAKIPNARSVTMPMDNKLFGHLNQFHPEVWKSHLIELLNSLPGA